MIFATVGTQLPFDRLLLSLDRWAAAHPATPVLAQTGEGDVHRLKSLTAIPRLSQAAFRRHVQAASVIVAHAGMGTVLTALEFGKPLVLMPRRAELGEHRNDHQLDTAAALVGMANVTIVQQAQDLPRSLNRVLAGLASGTNRAPALPKDHASPLSRCVREFIWAVPGRSTGAKGAGS